MTRSIQTEIPDHLFRQAQRMVDQGWATNIDSIIAESLRRYLESHEDALMEQVRKEDIVWGLHGRD